MNQYSTSDAYSRQPTPLRSPAAALATPALAAPAPPAFDDSELDDDILSALDALDTDDEDEEGDDDDDDEEKEGSAASVLQGPGISYSPALQDPDIRSYARRKATSKGIDPTIFVRLINQESGFQHLDPNAPAQDPKVFTDYDPSLPTNLKRSSAGALGIGQVMPQWHPVYQSPQQAIDYSAGHLEDLLRAFNGSYRHAVAAYNTGSENVKTLGLSVVLQPTYANGQTARFVQSILGPSNLPATGTGEAPLTDPDTPSSGLDDILGKFTFEEEEKRPNIQLIRNEIGQLSLGVTYSAATIAERKALNRAYSALDRVAISRHSKGLLYLDEAQRKEIYSLLGASVAMPEVRDEDDPEWVKVQRVAETERKRQQRLLERLDAARTKAQVRQPKPLPVPRAAADARLKSLTWNEVQSLIPAADLYNLSQAWSRGSSGASSISYPRAVQLMAQLPLASNVPDFLLALRLVWARRKGTGSGPSRGPRLPVFRPLSSPVPRPAPVRYRRRLREGTSFPEPSALPIEETQPRVPALA